MDFLKEILGIGTRLFHDRRIVAVSDFHFVTHLVKYKFHGNLRCVASLYERPSAICESGTSLRCRLRRQRTGFDLAGVLAKPSSGQAVVGTLGIFSAEQRGDGVSPSTIRAGPSGCIALNPDQRAVHIGNPKLTAGINTPSYSKAARGKITGRALGETVRFRLARWSGRGARRTITSDLGGRGMGGRWCKGVLRQLRSA